MSGIRKGQFLMLALLVCILLITNCYTVLMQPESYRETAYESERENAGENTGLYYPYWYDPGLFWGSYSLGWGFGYYPYYSWYNYDPWYFGNAWYQGMYFGFNYPPYRSGYGLYQISAVRKRHFYKYRYAPLSTLSQRTLSENRSGGYVASAQVRSIASDNNKRISRRPGEWYFEELKPYKEQAETLSGSHRSNTGSRNTFLKERVNFSV